MQFATLTTNGIALQPGMTTCPFVVSTLNVTVPVGLAVLTDAINVTAAPYGAEAMLEVSVNGCAKAANVTPFDDSPVPALLVALTEQV